MRPRALDSHLGAQSDLVPYYKPRGHDEHDFKGTNAATTDCFFGLFRIGAFSSPGHQIAGTQPGQPPP